MAIRSAKRPELYEGGFMQGVISEIVEGEGRTQRIRNKGKNVDEIDYKRMEFYIDCEAKDDETIEMKHFTGIVVNPDPVKEIGRGAKRKKFYNMFTQTCIQLGVLTELELEKWDEMSSDERSEKMLKISDHLATLSGTKIQFKSIKNDDGYWRIDPLSVSVIKSVKKKEKEKV